MTVPYPLVIAVDPGATTGIAACTLVPNPDDELQRTWPTEFSSIEVPEGIDGFSRWFFSASMEIMEKYRGNVLWVVERFDITKRTLSTKIEYDALYIIGFLAGMNGLGNLKMRLPSARRVAVGKLYDWDNPTKDDHANDAAAHLKAWLVDTYPYLMEDLLLPPTTKDTP